MSHNESCNPNWNYEQKMTLPCNAPVRFNPQDSGVVRVVELDLWVSELGIINVHKH